MRQLSRSDLLSFQNTAASAIASMILEYPSDKFKPKYDSDTGNLLPFLCRLSAITGSGKTPMLAVAASDLKDGIILWTTNRGAVISQTLANLRPGGIYADLLPQGTQVLSIPEMSDADWSETVHRKEGLTILLSTVAAFNRDGDVLRIHRDRGDGVTPWRQLSGDTDDKRHRSLYIFYDEAHGTTEKQFQKLLELNPQAFVLASASALPDDLNELLPGKSHEDLEASLKARTVDVPTKEVVASGLLKQRLYFVDCNISQADAIREANDKWRELDSKFAPQHLTPIICFIVNETLRGVDVWEQLVSLGVSKNRIAVHLDGARDVIVSRRGQTLGLIDTYSGKKPAQRSPEVLREAGYSHIIWNLTLREGWDEPMAYVAYLDSRGKSQVDIVQKIGRFVRQPEGKPFEDPDLNSAFFYFNITDQEFENLLRDTQREMEGEGYELIGFKQGKAPPPSREVAPSATVTLERIAPWFGDDIQTLDRIVTDLVPGFSDDALHAKGRVSKRVLDLRKMSEDKSQRSDQERDASESITVWDFLTTRLRAIDDRIVNERYTLFSPQLREHAKMRQRVQYGSDAMRQLTSLVDMIVAKLNEEFRLVSMGKLKPFVIQPFKLVAPNASGTSDIIRERYKVRSYTNALHPEYNGMNSFEVQIADALDSLGKRWCRNPSRGNGYSIPIPQLGSGTDAFYPDFLLWNGQDVWALDPKGKHLTTEAITRKLLDLQTISRLKVKLQVAFMVEGHGTVDRFGHYDAGTPGGCTLIRRTSAGIKHSHHSSPIEMAQSLLKP